jgi:hypothetical protein
MTRDGMSWMGWMQRSRGGVLLAGWLGVAWCGAAATPLDAGLTPVPPPVAPPVSGVSAPRIQVEEPIHDFGRLTAGQKREHEFLVTNAGNAPLEISQVRTSCGCTTMGDWDRRIQPGATGRIPIRFDTANFTGSIQRTVTLVTNDPRQSQMVLQVKAHIWVPIEVSPRTVMFQYDSETTEGESREVRVASHLDEPLTFAGVRSEHPAFAVELEPVKPGREYRLRVRMVPPVGTGMITAPLVLEPSDPELDPIQVMAYAIERQPLTISPAALVLPAGPVRAGVRPAVTIRDNTGKGIELSEPKINLPGATVELSELQTNRLYRLTPVLPEGFELVSGQRLELTVKTSHPRHREIRVPITSARPVVQSPVTRSAVPLRTNAVVNPAARPLPGVPPAPPQP